MERGSHCFIQGNGNGEAVTASSRGTVMERGGHCFIQGNGNGEAVTASSRGTGNGNGEAVTASSRGSVMERGGHCFIQGIGNGEAVTASSRGSVMERGGHCFIQGNGNGERRSLLHPGDRYGNTDGRSQLGGFGRFKRFDDLLARVGARISRQDTNYRRSISAAESLSSVSLPVTSGQAQR
ncbi:unnamed protein product [Boreogadus saida]